jgi:hypothetical protein
MTNTHGSPADRGSSDRYYRRYCSPHKYVYEKINVIRVEEKDMTPEEIDQYRVAYAEEENSKWD